MAAFPGDWWGKVYIGGAPAPDGTPVSAYINGSLFDQTKVGGRLGSGYYELIIQNAKDGDNIVFKIGSVNAEQTAVFSDGAHARLDLILSAPACGDTICNGGETSMTCSADCGAYSSSPSGSSGSSRGSSGGGGGSILTEETTTAGSGASGGGAQEVAPATGSGCSPNWTCTEWTECAGGNKARICTDLNNCATDKDKPTESTTCTSAEEVAPLCGDGICSEGEDCPQDCIKDSGQSQGLFSDIISGRFITNPIGTWYIWLILAATAAALYVAFKIIREDKPKHGQPEV